MSEIAALSCSETAGMPASMRWMPIASSFLAIATFSSRRKTTAVCCSPSRSVTSWIFKFFWKLGVLPSFRQVVPRAGVPLVRLPRFLHVSSEQFVSLAADHHTRRSAKMRY